MATQINPIKSSDSTSTCLQQIIESTWTDVVLIIGSVALLIIGILASSGVFSFMGTTQAAHLSYGMYATAALLMIAAVVKYALNRCKTSELPNSFTLDPNKSIDEQVKHVEYGWKSLTDHNQAYCTITFANGYTAKREVDGVDRILLMRSLEIGKIYHGNSFNRMWIEPYPMDQYPIADAGIRTAQQVIEKFL